MNRKLKIAVVSAVMVGITTLWFSGLTKQAVAAQAGAQRKTVWSGVYADSQAERGQKIYDTTCNGCHGLSLEGGRANPALKGDKFMDNWGQDNLDSLFSKMRKLMPRRDPGSLMDSEYLDLLSYIMKANGFPSGTSELKADGLKEIQIEPKDGPKPLPNRTTVRVIGCLVPGEGDSWMLSTAGQPMRTRTPDSTSPEELKDAETQSLGTLTFQVQNLEMIGAFHPEAHKGHRMQAKGVLLRNPAGDRISLTSLEMISANCASH